MKKIKAFILAVVFILTALSFVACVDGDDDGDTSGLTESEQLQKIVQIISDINNAENQSVGQLSMVEGLKFASPLVTPFSDSTVQTLEDVRALMIPREEGFFTCWKENQAFFNLLSFAANTIGGDALNYVYKIECENVFELPFGTVAARLDSIDIKGIHDGKLYGVLEGERENCSVKIMLSAYYNNQDDYGYEIFAYGYGEDMESLSECEYLKFDKQEDDSFLRMHIYNRLVLGNQARYSLGNKNIPTEMVADPQIYAVLQEELEQIKAEFFGEDDLGGILGSFRKKDEEVKQTYTDTSGQEQALTFEYFFDGYGFISPIAECTIGDRFSKNIRDFVVLIGKEGDDIVAVQAGTVIKIEDTYEAEGAKKIFVKHDFGLGEFIVEYTFVVGCTLEVDDELAKGQKIGEISEYNTIHFYMQQILQRTGGAYRTYVDPLCYIPH